MKLPKFKPSTVFVEDIPLPCLVAKIPNSKLPDIGARHIAEFKEDPKCGVYLRGKEPHKISPWQQQVLDQLLKDPGLGAIVSEAMKEYASSDRWGGKDYAELSEEDRRKIRRYGIAAYVVLSRVVIDEVKGEVILEAGTILDGNLDEHGISIYFKRGRWRFDTCEYFINYVGGLEESHRPTAEELRRAQAAEISRMATELAPAFDSSQKSADAWEALFPRDPEAPVDTNPNFLYGDWQFDVRKTIKICKSLGQDKALIEAKIENQLWQGLPAYRISPTSIGLLLDGRLTSGDEFCGCERRGNRVIIRSCIAHGRKKLPVSLEYWCDGQFLIDHGGNAFKRL
jgi:hypothetical protein